jgi:hypothetical protein
LTGAFTARSIIAALHRSKSKPAFQHAREVLHPAIDKTIARRSTTMAPRILRTSSAVLFAFALTVTSAAITKAEDGIVKVKSAYSVAETINRLKADIAAKGIRFFSEIDQSKPAWVNATGVRLCRRIMWRSGGRHALHRSRYLRIGGGLGVTDPVAGPVVLELKSGRGTAA